MKRLTVDDDIPALLAEAVRLSRLLYGDEGDRGRV